MMDRKRNKHEVDESADGYMGATEKAEDTRDRPRARSNRKGKQGKEGSSNRESDRILKGQPRR